MMKSSTFRIVAISVLGLFLSSAAQAQASRTWVSGVGDDANPCSRTAPCKTFAGAISKTAASGEIDTLDPGGFGTLTITKAITIRRDGGGTGGVTAPGTNGFVIAAGASDVVQLIGIDIDGLGTGAAGVQFNSGAQLIIDHCAIYGFQGANGVGSGVNFQPSAASRLEIVDSLIANNGSTGGALGGSGNILIQPKAGGSAMVQIERTQMLRAFANNFRADGSVAGSGAIAAALHNDTADGGNAGIVAAAGTAAINVMVDTVTVSNNVGFGIRSVGAGATIRVTNSTVTGNATGLGSASAGALLSYQNNNVSGNTADGAPTGTVGHL
jgi:hypothetical protein